MSCISWRNVYRTETTYELVAEPAWDGSAINQETLSGDGVFQFSVPRSSPGVVVGLSSTPTGKEYEDIDVGVLFNNGSTHVVISGEVVATIGAVDYAVYSLVRDNGVVHFFGSAEDEWVDHPQFRLPVPGTRLHTFQTSLHGIVFFKAYLYSVADILTGGCVSEWGEAGSITFAYDVVGAEDGYEQGSVRFTPLHVSGTGFRGGTAEGEISLGYEILGSEDGHGQGAATFYPVTVQGDSSIISGGVAGFEPLYVVGADYNYSYGEVELVALVSGREKEKFQINYSTGLAVFGNLRVSGFEGGIRAANQVTFQPLEVLGSEDGDYAQGSVSFPAPDSFGLSFIVPESYLIFYLHNPIMRTGQLSTSMREVALVGDTDVGTTGTIYTRRVLQADAAVAVDTFYNPTSLVEDVVQAKALALPVQAEQLLLEGLAGSELSAVAAIHAAETLYAQGEVQTFYQGFVEAVLAAQVLVEMPEGSLYQQRETLSAQAEGVGLVTQIAEWADEVLATLNTENRGVFVVQEELVAESDDLTEALAKLMHEGVLSTGAWLGMRLSGEVHTAWATNLEGNMPVSQYQNYGFNSFAEVGGEYFAASDDGLYRLGADQDDGQPIDAAVGSMMLDLGTSRQKRVQAAYIGYTASGRIVLKVRSEDDGEVVEDWFEAQQQTAAAPRNQMVRVGRGLRSRYWQFELVNVQGADFELDSLEMYPITLNRRV